MCAIPSTINFLVFLRALVGAAAACPLLPDVPCAPVDSSVESTAAALRGLAPCPAAFSLD